MAYDEGVYAVRPFLGDNGLDGAYSPVGEFIGRLLGGAGNGYDVVVFLDRRILRPLLSRGKIHILKSI